MNDDPHQVVLIVGAATPAGRSIAEAFADVGAHLLLTDVDGIHLDEVVEAIATRTGTRPDRRLLRVTDAADWSAAADLLEARFGRVDVVVNAAEYDPAVHWRDATADEWSVAVAINLRGVVEGIAAVLPALRRAGGAVVVVAVAEEGAAAAVRSATRSAAVAFARSVRDDLAPEVSVVTAVVTAGREGRAGGRIISELSEGNESIAVNAA